MGGSSSEATLPEQLARSERVRAIGEAHTSLLSAYLDVIKEASTLPLLSRYEIFYDPRPNSHFRNPLMWRGLTRIFVEAHMRRILTAISKLHLLERQVARNPSDARAFEAAAQSAQIFLDQFRSWQRLRVAIAAAWPILFGLVLAALSATSLYDIAVKGWTFLHARAFVAAVLGLVALYVMLPLRQAFLYQRELFCPAVTLRELPTWRRRVFERAQNRQTAAKRRVFRASGRDVYLLEDEVFRALGVGKPREPRLDLLFGIIVTLPAAVLFAYVLGQIGTAPFETVGWATVVGSLAFGAALGLTIVSPVMALFMIMDTWRRRAR